jgi:hypothetical protein
MKEYEYFFEHEELDDSRASYLTTYSGSCCTITLATEWFSKTTKEKIRMAAFHEITELMLIGLRRMAFHTFAEDVVEHETHKIIRRLENSVFDKLK